MMPDVTRLDTLRARRPLIHCISNLVTANDCANLLLAAAASIAINIAAARFFCNKGNFTKS